MDVDEACLRYISSSDTDRDIEVAVVMEETADVFERENPGLQQIEEIGKADTEYTAMLRMKRDGTAHKLTTHTSEARKMGGEWSNIEILKNWEILVLKDAGQQRIIPPKKYR